ncbi:hypothetical protein BTS2_0523 [Bacillus sp. TS-2]|nr:hypothetical protein BTS2_0523 [Bacillus sp. TS-2]
MSERNKWEERGEKLEKMGEGMQSAGSNMMGCGCLLTIIITIPILLFIFL